MYLLYAQYIWSVDTEQAGQCGKKHGNIRDACHSIRAGYRRAGCQQQHGHQQQLLRHQCNGRQQEHRCQQQQGREQQRDHQQQFTKLCEGINIYYKCKTSELFNTGIFPWFSCLKLVLG